MSNSSQTIFNIIAFNSGGDTFNCSVIADTLSSARVLAEKKLETVLKDFGPWSIESVRPKIS